MPKMLVTVTIGVDKDGNIYQDTNTHGNEWAEVYRGMVQVKDKVDQLVADRRVCPYNPRYGAKDHK